MQDRVDLLKRWHIDADYLTDVVDSNPSLRGMIAGYVAEKKLFEIFRKDERVTSVRKDDDHDREKKGDVVIDYKGEEFIIEVKSLQTNSIKAYINDQCYPLMNKEKKWNEKTGKNKDAWKPNPDFFKLSKEQRLNAIYKGSVQCDASDRRTVYFDTGESIETTCLLVGEFDILAAGLFTFREEWDFGFALNSQLPRSMSNKYSDEVKSKLLKSLVPVTWPLSEPFHEDPFTLLDFLVEQRSQTRA